MKKDSLFFKIQSSKLYNSTQLFFRNLKTKRGVNNYKKSLHFSFNKGKIFIILFFIIVILIFGFNLNKYFQLNFSSYLTEEEYQNTPKILPDSKDVNVLLVGFDDTQNTHKFMNMLAIISLDYQTASLKIYNINPNYLVGINNNSATLRTAYNLLTVPDSEKMNNIMKLVENTSAVRIDRYLAFNYSDITKLNELTGLSLESDKSYKIGEAFITEGKILRGEELSQFVATGNIPDDDTLRRQSNYLKALFDNLRDNLTLYRYFLNWEDFSEIIFTNFTKDEFIRFILNVSSIENTIQTEFASSELTLEDLSKLNLENGVQYSDMLLDENISNLFRNIPIIKEQAKIEVFNATDKSGVAYSVKRKLENAGVTVIKTGNYPDNIKENILYLPNKNPENFENSIRFVRSILRDNVSIIYGEYKFNYSGDMILVIGNY